MPALVGMPAETIFKNPPQVVTAVPAMVRVEIERSSSKRVVCCLMYPVGYPDSHILVELKSKTLSEKLLDGLTNVCEKEAKGLLGRPQALHVLRLVGKFIEDNPLCCCSEEIGRVKERLCPEDSLKLSQKSCSLTLVLTKNRYYLKAKIRIPDDYPVERIDIACADSNFPRVFRAWFVENSKEIARRCVEPPLRPRPKAPKFEPRPSLQPAVSFLLDNVKRYPVEECQICKVMY